MKTQYFICLACICMSSCQVPEMASDPIRLEAEMGYENIVQNYFEVEKAEFYSGGGAVMMSGRVPVGGSGTIEYRLTPHIPPGIYTLNVKYNDENDGHSPVKIEVDGQVFSFVMDANTSSGFADISNQRQVEFKNVRVKEGSILRVTGTVHRYESEHKELVRLDYFEFSKA